MVKYLLYVFLRVSITYSILMTISSSRRLQGLEATNKRYLLAIDVTDSMLYGHVLGSRGLSPLKAAAAMALITRQREAHCDVVSLARDVTELTIDATMDLSLLELQLKMVCTRASYP